MVLSEQSLKTAALVGICYQHDLNRLQERRFGVRRRGGR
jgi:hypothetical protein